MNVGQIRFIKRALFTLFLGCGAYVGYHLWQGVRSRGRSTVDIIDEPQNPTSRGVELEQLDSAGRTAWTLKAAESVGHTQSGQQFRDVEILFNTGDDETPIVVTADHCVIGADRTVHLEGNVVVHDDTTVRLEANTLEFGRFPDRVWSTEPVKYEKKGLSGEAGSMHYVIKRGELDFSDGVRMTLQEDGAAPVRIVSEIAHMRRNQHWVQYVDDVRVRQKNRSLSANDLQLFLDDDNQEITRVEAYENVDLRMRVTTKTESPDSEDSEDSQLLLTSEPGMKQLVTDRLEMLFRPGGENLERVRAREGGKLIMRLPVNAVDGYDKRLEGHTLAFDFDEDGQLTALRGRGGVKLVLTPRGPDGGDKKIVTARQLESDFDPKTGELIEARCVRSVEFEQSDVRATSERGVLRSADSLLTLTESPRLWDARANLEAEKIEIDLDSGNVEGYGDVRSSSLNNSGNNTGDNSGGAGLFPSADENPVYFVAEHMTYDRGEDVVVYAGSARGFQGRSRVEAETIRIYQREGNLVADGGVRTVFLHNLVEDDASEVEPKPTVTRAATLHYRALEEVLEYREDVHMRSADMTLQAASIDVTLKSGGSGVREIDAKGDVEIETVDGTAAGDHARYLPEDKSMTITGEDAWLENAGKLTEGKQLTFFLTDDRILVDGQEQHRTKTTYSSNPRPF